MFYKPDIYPPYGPKGNSRKLFHSRSCSKDDYSTLNDAYPLLVCKHSAKQMPTIDQLWICMVSIFITLDKKLFLWIDPTPISRIYRLFASMQRFYDQIVTSHKYVMSYHICIFVNYSDLYSTLSYIKCSLSNWIWPVTCNRFTLTWMTQVAATFPPYGTLCHSKSMPFLLISWGRYVFLTRRLKVNWYMARGLPHWQYFIDGAYFKTCLRCVM